MEAAYKRILFAEAGKMLYFQSKEELVQFAKEVCPNLSDLFRYFNFFKRIIMFPYYV